MSTPLSTDQLANDARCIDKCIPDGEKFAVLISIMAQILANGGGTGGGSGSVLSGNGTPNGVITATEPAIYYDKQTGVIYEKTGSGNTGWN